MKTLKWLRTINIKILSIDLWLSLIFSNILDTLMSLHLKFKTAYISAMIVSIMAFKMHDTFFVNGFVLSELIMT